MVYVLFSRHTLLFQTKAHIYCRPFIYDRREKHIHLTTILSLRNVSQATQPEYHSSVSDRISFIRSLTTAFFPLMTVVCLIFLSTTSQNSVKDALNGLIFLPWWGFRVLNSVSVNDWTLESKTCKSICAWPNRNNNYGATFTEVTNILSLTILSLGTYFYIMQTNHTLFFHVSLFSPWR